MLRLMEPMAEHTYDSFGNMSLMSGATALSSFDAMNRTSNLPCGSAVQAYDAAGNQLCSTDQFGGVSQYSYDAESRINQIAVLNSQANPFVRYTYLADSTRVRKDNAGGSWTEYVYFNGQPLAEKDQTGTWTDYIYANGQKVAKESPASSIWVHGSNSQPVEVAVQLGLSGSIRIAAGDRLNWWQSQQSSGGTSGGLNLTFDNQWQLNGSRASCTGQPAAAVDQNGAAVDKWQGNFGSEWRTVDLSAFAGHSVSAASLVKDSAAPGGSWDLFFGYISISHSNGQVDTIYNSVNPISLNEPPVPGLANAWVAYGGAPTTRFYLDDHLGTTQMELSAGGYPLWKGEFAPFGQELDTQNTAMHYKFTGKERDTESGLDYFGARYYASSMGRWMSPDWADKPEAVPYSSLANPQSLNLYQYVGNNPLSKGDADGHCWPICGWIVPVSTYLATHPDIGKAFSKVTSTMGIKASLGVGGGAPIKGGKVEGSATAYASFNASEGVGAGGQLKGAAKIGGVGPEVTVNVPIVQGDQMVNPLKASSITGAGTLTGESGKGAGAASVNGHETSIGGTYGEGVVGGLEVSTGTSALKDTARAIGDAISTDVRQIITDVKETLTYNGSSFATPRQ